MKESLQAESPINVNPGLSSTDIATGRARFNSGYSSSGSSEEHAVPVLPITVNVVNIRNLVALMKLVDSHKLTGSLGQYQAFYKRNLKRAINLYIPFDELRKVVPSKHLVDEPVVALHLYLMTKNFTVPEFALWYASVISSDRIIIEANINSLLRSHAKELELADIIQLQGNSLSVSHIHQLDPDQAKQLKPLVELSTRINTASEAISTVTSPVSKTLNYVHDGLDRVHDSLDDFVSGLNSEINLIPGMDNSVLRGLLVVITPLVLVFLVQRGLKSTPYRISAGALFALTLNYSPDKFKTPLKAFAAGSIIYWFLHPQDGENKESEDPVQLQSSVLTALLCTYFMQSGFSKEHTNQFTNSVRTSKDISSLIESVLGVFKTTLNFISLKSVGYEIFTEVYMELEHLEIEFDALMLKANSGQIEYSQASADRIRTLRSEYRKVAMSKSTTASNRNLYAHATRRMATLESLLKAFDGFLSDPTGLRQEPTSLCLCGPPRTFKTVLADIIKNDCLRISLSNTGVNWRANRANYIYNRKAEDFWEGYNALTELLFFDDFGQQRDSVGSPNPNYMDLISAYNTAPFPLPMAAVENKGKHFMKARWILATTNQCDGFMVNSLVSEEAVNQRFDFNITIVVKKEYANSDGSLNVDHPSVKTEQKGHHNIRPEFYLFRLNSLAGIPRNLGYQVGQSLEYCDLITALSSVFSVKKTIYQSTASTLESREPEMQSGITLHKALDYLFGESPLEPLGLEEYGFLDQDDCQSGFDVSFLSNVESISNEQLAAALRALDIPPNTKSTIESFAGQYLGLYSQSAILKIPVEEVAKLCRLYAFLTVLRPNCQRDCTISKAFAMCSSRGLQHTVNWMLSHNPDEWDTKVVFNLPYYSTMGSIRRTLVNLGEGSYWFRIVGGVLLAVGSVSAVWYASHSVIDIISDYFPLVEDQSNYLNPKISKTRVSRTSGPRQADRVQFQGGDLASFHLLVRFKKNIYTILISHFGGETIFGKGIFVDDKHFLIPKHFLADARYVHAESAESRLVLRYETPGKPPKDYDFSIPEFFTDCVEFDRNGEHCVMVKIDKMNFPKKDLIPHFLTDEDVSHLPSQGLSILVSLPSLNDVPIISEARLDKIDFRVLKMAKGIHYSVDSGKGDCGSPLYLRDTRFAARRLMGFHIAGTPKGYSSRNAYASFITKESIELMRDALSPPLCIPSDECPELQGAVNAPIFEVIGTAPQYHEPYNTTKIVPSPLQRTHYPKPTKVPARLYPKDGNDPLVTALSKLRFKDVDPEERSLSLAVEDLKSFLTPPDIIHLKDFIEFSEVLYGHPMIPNRVGIPVSTSAGYPYKFVDRDIKKRVLPKDTPHFDKATYDKLKDEFYFVIMKANAGIRLDWYYLLSLKDETKSEEKVLAWDTRLFCGTPFMLFAVTKSLFGQFVEYFFTECLDKENASTLNPYQGWKTLAHKLSRFDTSFKTTKVDSSDFKAFDASNNPTIMLEVLGIIQNWYRQQGLTEHEKAREVIFCEVYNSKHICQDKVYEWFSSLPSGSYLTLVVNCLTNQLLFRYSYYRVLPREITYKHSFHSRVSFVCLGDDNIYSAHADIRDVFNPVSIATAVKELGFTMTSDTKTALGDWRDFSTVSFLKRGFRFDGKEVLCPLDLNTLHNTPQWTKRGPLFRKIFSDNLVFFFRELSLHSPDVWEEKSAQMLTALRDLGEPLVENPDLTRGQRWWKEVVMSSDYFSVEL